MNGQRDRHNLSPAMHALVGPADKQQVQVLNRSMGPLNHGVFEDLLNGMTARFLLARREPMGSFWWWFAGRHDHVGIGQLSLESMKASTIVCDNELIARHGKATGSSVVRSRRPSSGVVGILKGKRVS